MKDKIIISSFIFVLVFFFLFNIFLKDEAVSLEERRLLKTFPEIKSSAILSGSWMKDFETYTVEQFPLRNYFRKVKALTKYYIFNELDNNNIFIKDDNILKIEYPLNEKSVYKFTKKINTICDDYLKNKNIYYAIIPDQNYYLEDSKYLKLDYEKMYEMLNEELDNLSYIDLRDLLSFDSYYKTDTHWRQEAIIPVANKLIKEMTNSEISNQYKPNTYSPFYGVYYGQAAMGGNGEVLTYLTNDVINSAYVENYEDSKVHAVYDLGKLGSMDSYDVFLSGATPYITITNSKNNSGRELVIFRDSFGSSITPLLIEGYSKITLIDLRYINMKLVSELIIFDNQDILFLYSTMIINNSDSLKV